MRLRRADSPLAATLLALAALAILVQGAAGDDVSTTAGKKVSGKLVSVDAKGVTFQTPGARVEIPGRDIVAVDLGNKVKPTPPDATFALLELTDGSSIRFAKFALKGTQVEGEPLFGEKDAPKYDIPTRSVLYAVKKGQDAKIRQWWDKMMTTRGKRDLYVIEKEDGLTFLQGTITSGSDDGRQVTFEKEGGGSEALLQSRSAGYVFAQPQPASVPATLCRVLDVHGNALNAASVAISEKGVTVTTVSGATVRYPSTAAISKFDYQQGNVAFVSDLNPKVDGPELPADEQKLNPAAAFLKDRSISNDALKLDNVIYQKGLCVAPDTVLTYSLDGGYTQFKALAGIDENGLNATSAAKLTVEADGQVLFTQTLSRKDKAVPLVLTVKGVKQLRVIVEADTPLNGNYVVLADARVQK